VASLIPKTFNLYGVSLSSETARQQLYTRALRLYGSMALTYNTEAGAGYAFAAGLATSIFGPDHLSLGINLEKGGSSAVPHSTIFRLNYWSAY
jgi:hypothetical protein